MKESSIYVEQVILKSIRENKKLTQSDMADLIGVESRETYANKERGLTQFKASEMFIISDFFNIDITQIFLPPNFMKHEVKYLNHRFDTL